MYRILLLVTLSIPSQVDGQIDRNRKWPAYRSGTAYRKALEQPFSSRWKNRPLRNVLLQIAENSKVAILLDRRIDPTRLLDISLDAPTLRQGMQELGRQVGAEASFPDGVVYLGPEKSTKKLRTLVHLRVRDLQGFKGRTSREREKLLLRRGRFVWKDLDSPKDILEKLSQQHAIEIEGIEQIPHDLWFGAALPYASFVDVLSLVLIQFDKTFRWSSDFSSVEIVPVPERVFVERTYRMRKDHVEIFAKLLRSLFLDTNVDVRGTTVVVKATLDIHDAIAQLQKASRKNSSQKPKKKISELPLDQRSISNLKFRSVPARSLLAALKSQGFLFEYDEKQLAAAGVNLDVKLTIIREKISAVDFVKEICRQIGVDCEISGRTVKLKPKK